MAFVKKTWQNRISEYPNRRTINDGYTTKQVTVGRDEGIVSEEGDAFNAENMNDLEDRIDDAINSVNAPDELTNVVISSPQSGQVLKYNGSIWVNGSGGGGGGGTDDYSDLINKPQINGVTLSGNKTTSDLNISYNDISGTPSLAAVATSGDYTDLTSKPKINGEILSGNKTSADLSIPTKIKDQDDTLITTPSDGDVLRYNGDTDKWENVGSPIDISSEFTVNTTSGTVQAFFNPATRLVSGVVSFYSSSNISTSFNIMSIGSDYLPLNQTQAPAIAQKSDNACAAGLITLNPNGTTTQSISGSARCGYATFNYFI